jgi:hypothetical protein
VFRTARDWQIHSAAPIRRAASIVSGEKAAK